MDMAEYDFDTKNRQVQISDGESTVNISFDKLEQIRKEYDKIILKEDVKSEISSMIENGELPTGAASNEGFIDAVTDTYAENRESLGYEYGYTYWYDCLEDAFAMTQYGDFSKEEYSR